MTKNGCFSKSLESHKELKLSKTREQTAITCLNQLTKSCVSLVFTRNRLNMDTRTIDIQEIVDRLAETRHLISQVEGYC